MRQGSKSLNVLFDVIEECGARSVYVNKLYEPWLKAKDQDVQAALSSKGCEMRSFLGGVLFEPEKISIPPGYDGRGHWGTLTPFLKACGRTSQPPRPRPRPSNLRVVEQWPVSEDIDSIDLARMPRSSQTGKVHDWGVGIRGSWEFGEKGAKR